MRSRPGKTVERALKHTEEMWKFTGVADGADGQLCSVDASQVSETASRTKSRANHDLTAKALQAVQRAPCPHDYRWHSRKNATQMLAMIVRVTPGIGAVTPSHLLDRISPISSPENSRFLCVFTASPRRFQRAQNRNPGPRNSVKGAQTPFRRPS